MAGKSLGGQRPIEGDQVATLEGGELYQSGDQPVQRGCGLVALAEMG